MSKKLTEVPPNWSAPQDRETITLDIKTITPMFGGGHKTGEIDTEWPIRPAAIRGALRFWWRATAGAQFQTATALYQQEARLWGREAENNRSGQSRIAIEVLKTSPPSIRDSQTFVNGTDAIQYALFPFIQNKQSGANKGIIATIQISIRDTNPNEIQDILAAISYWIYFGGVGARTRRGCGALELLQSTHKLPSVLPGAYPKQIQNITGCPIRIFLGKTNNDANIAWQAALQAYRDFRQAPDDNARNRSYQRRDISGNLHTNQYGKPVRMPGRSLWPEPDTLRTYTGQAANYLDRDRIQKNHTTRVVAVDGFPRADLGLPIIFHFKDNNLNGTDTRPDRDPRNTTLEPPSGYSRFASPVVVKAVAVGGNQYRPLIALLDSPPVWEYGPLRLTGTTRTISRAQIELNQAQRNSIRRLNGHASVREALCGYVINLGWTEVAR